MKQQLLSFRGMPERIFARIDMHIIFARFYFVMVDIQRDCPWNFFIDRKNK